MSKKILCIGCVTTDIIVTPADSIPTPGTLRAVDNVTTHVGGCASNAAIDLAKLGIPVGLSCKVGKDSFGEFVIKTVSDSGADISGIIADEKVSTTVSIVCVSSSGERSFLYNPGSTSAFNKSDITEKQIDEYDIIFVAGAMLLTSFDGIPCAETMKAAKTKGKFTVMDTAWDFEDKWLPKVAGTLPYLDLFMPSYEEAVKLSGETKVENIAEFFISMGAKNIIIKLGKDGAYIREENGKRYILPTYSKIKPVDTTGAGDAFCAGFLCGLSQGWSFEESGKFANAVGTHCVMKIGASTGIKSMAEIKKFMNENELL
ncbi:MAG: Fructokinase [Clostridia bacterium]|nr:Fructokinase [Clostridia bacterium]